jgi:hypothetical protein
MNAGARDMRLTDVNPARMAAACLAVATVATGCTGGHHPTHKPTKPDLTVHLVRRRRVDLRCDIP